MSSKKPVMSHDPLADLNEDEGNEVVATSPVASEQAEAESATADADADAALCLDATLTIAEVAEVQQIWVDRLEAGGQIRVDGSRVEIIDGAGLQLVAALFKEASRREMDIGWSGSSEVLQRAAETFGLSETLGLDSGTD